MSYDDIIKYMRVLRSMSKHSKVGIEWNRLDPERVQAIPHGNLPGLLMADVVASSLYYAVNPNKVKEVEPRYYELLKDTIWRRDRSASGLGLKFFPESLQEQMKVHPRLSFFEQ